MRSHLFASLVVVGGVSLLALGACTGTGGGSEGDEEAVDTSDRVSVPADAAAVENPVEASAESIDAGGETYLRTCALCHGESGQGDGPGAVGLDPAPAHLDQRVPGRKDGELFWIITNGVEGSAMPSWEAALSEDQRWDVVNYLQDTFG